MHFLINYFPKLSIDYVLAHHLVSKLFFGPLPTPALSYTACTYTVSQMDQTLQTMSM